MCPILPLPCTYFNSQPHKEADLDDPVFVFVDHISTHSLTRRLTFIFAIVFSPSEISTHSLTRRLTSTAKRMITSHIISTHSLTRRLTDSKNFNRSLQSISTHSLTRRLTKRSFRPFEWWQFQLTASQGG